MFLKVNISCLWKREEAIAVIKMMEHEGNEGIESVTTVWLLNYKSTKNLLEFMSTTDTLAAR